MPSFWKIKDKQIYSLGEVPKLGFPKNNPKYIPIEYLENEYFTIMRTAFSVGDWGILSVLPRALKTKYPNKKIIIPTPEYCEEMFSFTGWWREWDNPYRNPILIFKNNPYIDGMTDEIKDIIYHDHYRVYDSDNENIPLVDQILRFWRFSEEEIAEIDTRPELYFSEEEKELGDKIIKECIGEEEYGCLLFGSRKFEIPWDYEWEKPLIELVEKNKDLPFFYFCQIPIEKTRFNIPDKLINFQDILKNYNQEESLRIQFYIKNKAKINIGYQSGINDSVGSRNTEMHCIPYPKQFLGSNIVKGINYYIKGEHFKI